MKKQKQFRVLAILLILWGGRLTAQDTESLFSMDLPSVVATSPESASLGRYGGLSNTSATGQMSHNIPLYNIPLKSGGWSVSLGYHFGGLMLEGKPSLSGLGWTLMAGGVVNREVRGLADDSQHGYYGSQSKRALVEEFAKAQDYSNPLTLTQMRNFMSKKWDAEPDKYSVSVAGISFSFKLDANGEAVYLSKHAHKVYATKNRFTFKIDQFRVVASNGVTYTFADKEQSVPKDHGRDEDFDLNLYTDTSWMLSKVAYPNGEEITFDYELDYMLSYDFVAIGAIPSSDKGCTSECPSPNYTATGEYSDQTTPSTIKRQILKNITFPMGSIGFGFDKKTLSTPDNRTLYHSVTIKDMHNKVIDSYSFEYEGNRDLLTSIKRKEKQFYDFEYYNKVNIPFFISSPNDKATNQDYWGYYNRAQNQYALTIPKSPYKAYRKPNMDGSQTGALKKIIYPTRGYTEIGYESNDVPIDTGTSRYDYYASAEISDKEYGIEISGQGWSAQNSVKEISIPFTFTRPTVGTLLHSISGKRYQHHVILEMKRVDDTPCPYGQYEVYPAPFYMYYQNPQKIREEGLQKDNGLGTEVPIMCPTFYEEYGPDEVAYGDDSQNNVSYGSSGRIVFLPGTYVLRVYTNTYSLLGFSAKIGLRLEKGWDQPIRQEVPKYISKKVGGIRVASMKDCGTSDSDCQERRFSYTDKDNFSSGVLNIHPVDEKTYKRLISTKHDIPFTNGFHTYSTEYYSVINPAIGTPVYYSSIKEIRLDGHKFEGDIIRQGNQGNSIDQWREGYTVREYEVPRIYTEVNYPQIYQISDAIKERLASEKVYGYNADSHSYTLRSVAQNEYREFRNLLDPKTQQDSNSKHPWGLTFDRKLFARVHFDKYRYDLQPSSIEEEEAIKALYAVAKYRDINTYHRLQSTTRKEIIDGEELSTKQTLIYNPANYEVANTIRKSSTGKVTESIVRYPVDIANPSLAEQRLQNSNILTMPIESKHYLVKDGDKELLSTQHIVYKNWQDQVEWKTYTNTLPELMQTAKGVITGANPLEDRLTYHKYDYKGNPIEVSKKDGTRVVYVWGYHEYYPIAKIENTTYTDVAPYVAHLKTKSNADIDRTKDYRSTEGALRQALDNLRAALPSAIVATYTYDPLIGITSMTDANGYTSYYEYDTENRLDHITDADGKVLKKYRYNYTTVAPYVKVYPPLGLEITSDHTNLIRGTDVRFKSKTSGGSGDYTYLWKINGDEVSTYPGFTKTFSTPGTYTVSCTINDPNTEQIPSTKTKTIVVYNQLNSPSLSYVKSPYHNGGEGHFSSHKKVSFVGENTGGGSGSYSYAWLVNEVDQGNNTTTFSKTFSPGTHKVTFRVIDALIPQESVDKTMTIKSYGPITIDDLTYDHTGFKTLARGGSSNYRYDWYVNTTSGSPYQSSASSYFIHNYMATASSYQTIYCRAVDLKSGYVTGFKSMRVYFHGQGNNGGGQGNNGGQGDGQGEVPTGGDQ